MDQKTIDLIANFLPLILLLGVWMFFMKKSGGKQNEAMAGQKESIELLREIRDLLKSKN